MASFELGHPERPESTQSVIGRLLSHSRKQTFAVLLHRQDCALVGRSIEVRLSSKADVRLAAVIDHHGLEETSCARLRERSGPLRQMGSICRGRTTFHSHLVVQIVVSQAGKIFWIPTFCVAQYAPLHEREHVGGIQTRSPGCYNKLRSMVECLRSRTDMENSEGAADAADSGVAGELGLGQYAQRFAENDISFVILPDLTDQDLEKIGVASLGHRRVLLRAIADLNRIEKSPSTVPAAATVAPLVLPPRRHRSRPRWRHQRSLLRPKVQVSAAISR